MPANGGCVAGGSPLTVQAGLRALDLGGNAVDAAVAAQLMACIAEPLLTGLGGGGLATLVVDGQAHVLDFFTAMPGLGRDGPTPPMDEVVLDFGPTTQAFSVGQGSVAVPGMPFGLAALHQRWGSLPLSELARPAVHACSHGVDITPGFAEVARLLWPIQCVTPQMRALFERRGGSVQPGDRFVNPGLAQTLELFAEQGAAAFRSQGSLGAAILSCFTGSALTARDLDDYQAIRADPLRVARGQHEILLPPRPSAGGPMTAAALSSFASTSAPFTAAHAREVARSMSLAESLEPPLSAGLTTHLGAVDQQGNACTITSSLGETCGHLVPQAGLALNNFLGEADCNPPQAPTPAGRRLRTMMTPTVLRGPSSIHTLGSGGSSRIRSAVLHALLHLIDHGLHPRQAACGPRCHMEAGRLRVEAYGRPEPDFLARLADFEGLVTFEGPNMYFGGVHIAGRADGAFEGAGDPRRSGAFGILGASQR